MALSFATNLMARLQQFTNSIHTKFPDHTVKNSYTKTWSDLPTETQLHILKFCCFEVWSNIMLLDKSGFKLVERMVYDVFKIYSENSNKCAKEFYPLLFSYEAKISIKKDDFYKEYISEDFLRKIKNIDYIQTGKLILSINNTPVFGINKNAYLPLKILYDLQFCDAQILNSILNNPSIHFNASIRKMDKVICLSREWTSFFIRNIPIFLTQEKPINIIPILDIHPEHINGGVLKALQNHFSAIRNNFPPEIIESRRNILRNILETRMFIDDRIYKERLHPIIWAVLEGNTSLIMLLIKEGFNISAKNEKGETGLHIAAAKNQYHIVGIFTIGFIDAQTNTHLHVPINVQDNQAMTPLHHAAQQGHIEIVKYLHTHGADIRVKDLNQNTALQYAEQYGHTEIIEYLQCHERKL